MSPPPRCFGGRVSRPAEAGDRADNLKKAIAAYEAALTVFTREAFPRESAATQSNLDFVYRSEDLRKAMEFFNVVVRLQADSIEETIAIAERADAGARDWPMACGAHNAAGGGPGTRPAKCLALPIPSCRAATGLRIWNGQSRPTSGPCRPSAVTAQGDMGAPQEPARHRVREPYWR